MSSKTTDITSLKTTILGTVIVPGDNEYEAASTVLMAKGAPVCIVRPLNADDIARTVLFARAAKLVLSVRSGGHSNAGHSTNNGGIVIDLTRMNDVKVIDEKQHMVRIGGGALWGDIAKTLGEHGLAISSGDTKTVGVGGLTLAGGIGWMVRKYGLALDNLVAAEVVTADGTVLRVSEQEHGDLFWALRGGGGNFGVVANFEFRAHPCEKVYAGSIVYGCDKLGAVLKGWRDCMRTAPEELTTMVVVMPTLPDFGNQPPAAIIVCCYAGADKTAAMGAIDPLLHLDTVVHQDITEKEYADVLEEAHPPQGKKIIVNNTFIQDFSDEVIDTIANQSGQVLQIRSVGGAMNRIAPDAAAFAHRSSEVLIISPVFLPLDASEDAITAALAPWRKLAAFGSGAYINFFSQDGHAEIAASYPPKTYERLASIKKKYDPHNIFSQNYNIEPKI